MMKKSSQILLIVEILIMMAIQILHAMHGHEKIKKFLEQEEEPQFLT